jgi:hypothetical protein
LFGGRERMAALRRQFRDRGPSPEARAEMEAIREELEENLRPILSDDQMKKYLAIQKERAERMRRGGRGPRS